MPLLDHTISDFLEYLEVERNASQLTIRNYHHYLGRFRAFSGNIEVGNISPEVVRRYRLHLARFIDPHSGLPLKHVTQNYFLIALRAFLRYCAKRDIATLTPEKIELAKQEKSGMKILDRDQLELLLRAPDVKKLQGLRDRAMLETLFSTGMRVAELGRLNRDQINFRRREFTIIGKGKKERIVFLSERASYWIEKYLQARRDDYRPLFIRFQGVKSGVEKGESMRLTTRSIERVVEKYRRQAHISIPVTPHTLRHCLATDLLANGADIRSVQEILGHESITSTEIYTHVTNRRLRDIHHQYHSGDKREFF